MNTDTTAPTLEDLTERAQEVVRDPLGAAAAALAAEQAFAAAAQAQRDLGEAAATFAARLRDYQPPASDRPSGAARRRAEHERLKNGITPVEEKAGIPRGRQGVKRG